MRIAPLTRRSWLSRSLAAAVALASTAVAAPTAMAAQPASATSSPPSVTITSPGNYDLFAVGQQIYVVASASSTCCSIKSVTFYATQGGFFTQLIGVATSPPYAVPWKVTGGMVSLTAVATDSAGQTTTSPGVTVLGAVSDGF